MSKRNLSSLDRDIHQALGRIISENVIDGTAPTEQKISQGGIIAGQTAHGTLSVSATQVYDLGTLLEKDGKKYRYSKSSTAAAIVAGTLLESPAFGGAAVAAEEDLAVATSSAAGDTFGYATLGCSTGSEYAANALAGGHYIVNDGAAAAGEGQCMKILSHVATTTSGVSVKLNFTEAMPIGTTSGTSIVTIIANEYKNVIIATATTPAGMAVGVSRVAVPVLTPYFWCQRSGIAACLNGGTAQTIGKKLHRNLAVAGSVIIDAVACGSKVLTEVIGNVAVAGDATDTVMVDLALE